MKESEKILCIGDLILDHYVHGDIDRISPEAPIPILKANDKNYNILGGCGNVARNIFSANNIKVFIFDSLKPTPLISYAVRQLDCICGIVLTASHNPPEYNGYKVYWMDGGQIVPPLDKEIIQQINKTDYSKIEFFAKNNLIKVLDENIEEKFKKLSIKTARIGSSDRTKLKIVFTTSSVVLTINFTLMPVSSNNFFCTASPILTAVPKYLITGASAA